MLLCTMVPSKPGNLEILSFHWNTVAVCCFANKHPPKMHSIYHPITAGPLFVCKTVDFIVHQIAPGTGAQHADICCPHARHLPRLSLIAVSTRSSAIAEGRRDASCQLKSCQLPRNSAETIYTTTPAESMVWRWRFRRRVIDNVHSTMTRRPSRLPLSQES